jgi:hypothetical protein
MACLVVPEVAWWICAVSFPATQYLFSSARGDQAGDAYSSIGRTMQHVQLQHNFWGSVFYGPSHDAEDSLRFPICLQTVLVGF